MILFIGWARLATATLTFFNKTLPNFVKWIGKRTRLKRVEKANIKHIEETKKIDELFKDYVKHKVSKNKSSVKNHGNKHGAINTQRVQHKSKSKKNRKR
jgi:uncharacterized membrane protein YhiD involved in acid resistance